MPRIEPGAAEFEESMLPLRNAAPINMCLCFVFKARAETGRERNRGRAPVPGSGETFAADPDAERRLLQVRQGREDHLLQRRPLRHHGVEDLHRKSLMQM